MSRSQRDKGKRGELECRDVFVRAGINAHRSANQACREPGDPDVWIDAPGWFVEVKNAAHISIPAAVKQAREAKQRRFKDARELVYAHWTDGTRPPVAGFFVPNDADGGNMVARWIAWDASVAAAFGMERLAGWSEDGQPGQGTDRAAGMVEHVDRGK